MSKLAKPAYGSDSFNTDVWTSLQNGLSITDNMDGRILSIQTDGVYPIYVEWKSRNKPSVAWIGQLREISGTHTTVTTAPYLDWEITSDGRFKINNIAGLTTATPSNRFQITIIALAN